MNRKRWIGNQFTQKRDSDEVSRKAKRGQRALRSKLRLEQAWKEYERVEARAFNDVGRTEETNE